MNLHEYQSKELFSNAGIPILKGMVADSPQQAREVATQLQGDQWAVKAQVHAGGRGKAGGVKLVNNLDDVELNQIKDLEKQIYEKIKSSNPKIIENINNTGKLDEETEKKLALLIEEFKKKNDN